MSQPSHSSEMTSPSASDLRDIPPGANPVVLQWQHLASMDRQPPHFLSLLSSLTATDSRSSTTELCDANARIALNFMDEVIRTGKIPREHERNILNTMRKLAYNSGQVPVRYQVDRSSLAAEAGEIASGAFAGVQRGKLGDKTVAIRTLKIDRTVDNYKRVFCKEAITWMNFSHPNILKLISIDINSQTGKCSMISEMMVNGNIREYIRENSVNRHQLLEGVATGLRYLHERGIAHGDLKGSNILITNDTPPRACLADFGLATLAPSTEGATTTNTAGGTLPYMAPELLPTSSGNQRARPTKPADIYALGMVIFEVLTGLQPFYDRKWVFYDVMRHVAKGERPTKPDNAEQIGFGSGTWELVEECWKKEATKRPTVEQVLTHLTRVAASSAVKSPGSNLAEGGTRLPNSTMTTGRHRSTFSTNYTTLTNPTTMATLDNTMSSFSMMNARRTQSPDLAQHEKTNPAYHALSPGNSRSPPPTDRNRQPIPVDPQIILSKWRNLGKIKHINHQQLAPLVGIEANRKAVLKFRGEGAAVVINTIDKALKQTECPEKTRVHALKMLGQLAGKARQVPKSYLVGRWTSYKVETKVMAYGGGAEVKEGRLGGRDVAVKTLLTSKETNVGDLHKLFCRESVLWMNVTHPNILKLIAVDIKPREKKFSMISEMMANGNIMKYIRNRSANRLCLLRDVTRGLEHLHGLGIVHGDIKGANILIDNHEPPQACIADFGLSIFASSTSPDPTTHQGCGGTPGYMPPELFGGGAKRTKEVDIYAFGVVVYEVVTGVYQAGQCNRPEDPVESGFGQGTWEFLEECWDYNPQQRPTARRALDQFTHVANTSTLVDPSPEPPVPPSSGSLSSIYGSGMDSPMDGIPHTRFCCRP